MLTPLRRLAATAAAATLVVLATAGLAAAQVRSTTDPRGDAAAKFDLTRVTYAHRSRTTVINYRVVKNSTQALFGTRLAPYATDVSYDIYVLPPGVNGYEAGHAGWVDRYSDSGYDGTPCGHLRTRRDLANHTTRIWVPRACVGGKYTNKVHVRSYSWDYAAATSPVRDRTSGIWIHRG